MQGRTERIGASWPASIKRLPVAGLVLCVWVAMVAQACERDTQRGRRGTVIASKQPPHQRGGGALRRAARP